MSPIIATTFCPGASPLPGGAASTVPAASIPGTRGKLAPTLRPSRSFSSERLRPNASTRIRTHPSRSGGSGSVVSRRLSTGPGAESWPARTSRACLLPGVGEPVGDGQHAAAAAPFPVRWTEWDHHHVVVKRGRVALVTGSSRGLGAVIARRLAHDGFAVAVNGRPGDGQAEQVARGIRGDGGAADAFGA